MKRGDRILSTTWQQGLMVGGGGGCPPNENYDNNLNPLFTVFCNDILKIWHIYNSVSLI